MQRSDSIAALVEALAKAQAAFLPVKKTEKVDYPTTAGRKKYSYAPLSEVIEATRKGLTENGLAILQPTRIVNGQLLVDTWLCHASGEWLYSEMMVGDVGQTPQAEGSALTYKRRYSLSALLGIASEEDDDAQAVEDADVKEAPSATSPPVHWCQEHKTPFFRKGKMKSFAHPIGETGEWCHEHKEEKPEPPTPLTGSVPAGQTIVADTSPEVPPDFKSPSEFMNWWMHLGGLSWLDIRTALNIKTPADIKDLKEAGEILAKIKAARENLK